MTTIPTIRPMPLRNFYPSFLKVLNLATKPLLPFLYEVPVLAGVGDYLFSMTLDDVPLVFRFKWNGRLERWTLTIYDENENVIVAGRAVVNGIDLIGQYNDSRLPPGKLIAVSADDTDDADARYDDFGIRVKFYYYTTRVEE